jgi:excisionase family DNA binding protein
MRNNENSRMLTISEVAKLLNLHINTVRRWSDHGILKPYRIGPRGDRRFMRDDIICFLNTQRYVYKSYQITKRTPIC